MSSLTEVYERIRAGDVRARDEFFRQNLGLVWAVVNRYSHLGEKEELFQVGSIGLLKAIERFDPARGTKFSTYAFPLIVGEIRNFIRDQGDVKVSRKMREIARAAQKILESQGQNITFKAVSEQLGVAEDSLLLAMEASRDAAPLEEAPTLDNMGDFSDSASSRMDVEYALRKIDPILREVVLRRFFQFRSQAEVAQELGMSQAQVSRKEKEALRRMKALLEVRIPASS